MKPGIYKDHMTSESSQGQFSKNIPKSFQPIRVEKIEINLDWGLL